MPSLPMKQQAQIVLFKRGGRERIADLAGKGWSKYSERHGPVLASVSDKKQKPYGSSVLKIKWKCTFYLVDVYTTSPPVCVCVAEIVWDHPWGDLLEEVEHGMIILCSLSSSATGSILIDSLSFPSCRSTWASFEKGLNHFTFLSYRHASVVRIIACPRQGDDICIYLNWENERGKFFESRLGLQFRPIIDPLRECHRFLDF